MRDSRKKFKMDSDLDSWAYERIRYLLESTTTKVVEEFEKVPDSTESEKVAESTKEKE